MLLFKCIWWIKDFFRGMEHKNETFMFQEIILLGFSKDPKINTGLFVLFFMIYIVTVIGNGLMLCIVLLHSQLHIPMYFFLCILSILDLCYSTTVLPKLLGGLFSSHETILIKSCFAQIYIILLVEGCECILFCHYDLWPICSYLPTTSLSHSYVVEYVF